MTTTKPAIRAHRPGELQRQHERRVPQRVLLEHFPAEVVAPALGAHPGVQVFIAPHLRCEVEAVRGRIGLGNLGDVHLCGFDIPGLDELPADNRILRSNISQFEGQRAIRCSTGNWQPFLPEDVLLTTGGAK